MARETANASIEMKSDKDIEAQKDTVVGDIVLNLDAEEVSEYAASYLDDLMGSVNDSMGDKLNSLYLGDGGGDDDEPSADVIMLLATLALSKLGITLSVNTDWSLFDAAFGWTAKLSLLNTITLPALDASTTHTLVGVALLLVQPLCVYRMNYLSREHQRTLPAFPAWFRENVATKWLTSLFPLVLYPPSTVLTPFALLLWAVFLVIFIPTVAVAPKAGMACLLLALPAVYFTGINFFRAKAWQFVNLRVAPVVRMRQFENLCMREGTFLLFLFVASYAFVTNWFVAHLATWGIQTETENILVAAGGLLYSLGPLLYLYSIITDDDADRTFRLFRAQLVDMFGDEHQYTKIALLLESVLFSLVVVAFSSGDVGQLSGGLVVGVIFLVYYGTRRPYGELMENLSDLVARVCSVTTVLLGLVVATDSPVSPQTISVLAIIISCIGALWFLYTLDLKEMFLSQFFLALQVYAQGKAATYNEKKIRTLHPMHVHQLINSPIELYVLSAAQKIGFAVYRKDIFFDGKIIKQLADLDITWLDLQQCGYDVVKLKACGFTTEELMAVRPELNDMGDRSDIRAMYERAYNDKVVAQNYKIDRACLEMLHTLGCFYRDMGEHVLGMSHVTRCMETRSSILGAHDRDTLASMHYVGAYYTFLGPISAGSGTKLLRDAYALYLEDPNFGERHETTLSVMGDLGANLKMVGYGKEALGVLKRRFDLTVANAHVAGRRSDHPCTLAARLDYADVLIAVGDRATVSSLNLRRVMNRQKTVHGVDSRETLALMDKYVAVLQKQGNHRDAMLQNLECLAEKAATLGPEHSGTLESKFALAHTYIDMARYNDFANLRLEHSLKLQEQRLGVAHPTTISSRNKIGALFLTMGKAAEAKAMFELCYKQRVESLGEAHPLTVGVATNLASVAAEMNNPHHARAIFDAMIGTVVKSVGEEDQLTITIMINYCGVLQNIGDLDHAMVMAQKGFAVAERVLGEDHPLTISFIDILSNSHILRENWDEARKLAEKSVRRKQKIFEEHHPRMLQSMENLRNILQNTNNVQEAVSLGTKAWQLREQHLGSMHPETIASKAGLSLSLLAGGLLEEAIHLITECIRDAKTVLGPDHARVVEYYGCLGHAHCYTGHLQEALKWTKVAHEMTLKKFGKHHHQVKQYEAKIDWINNAIAGNTDANDAAAADKEIAKEVAKDDVAVAKQTIDEMDPTQLQLIKDVAHNFQAAQQYTAMNMFAEAVAVYEGIFAHPVLPQLVGTPVGDSLKLGELMMNMQTNYCISLFKLGKVDPTTDLLEDLLPKLHAAVPPVPVQGIEICRQMLEQIYTGTQKHDLTLRSITNHWEYYCERFGKISEEAITVLNKRAMMYMSLRDFKKGAEEWTEVMRQMSELQGADHPDTIASIKQAEAMFKSCGVAWTYP